MSCRAGLSSTADLRKADHAIAGPVKLTKSTWYGESVQERREAAVSFVLIGRNLMIATYCPTQTGPMLITHPVPKPNIVPNR